MKKQHKKMEKLFIDEQELKSRVPSSRNVSDTQTIFYSIKFAQRRELRPVVGADTFDYLIDKYTDTNTSLTPIEDTLVDMIKEVLSLMTYKRLINHLSFKMRDGGLRYSIGGADELAPTEDRNIIIREISKDIDVLINEITIYMKDNRETFTLMDNSCDVKSNVKLNIGKI